MALWQFPPVFTMINVYDFKARTFFYKTHTK